MFLCSYLWGCCRVADKGPIMKKIALLAFLLLANPAAAASTTANGPGALALAAIVASHARALRVVDRNVLRGCSAVAQISVFRRTARSPSARTPSTAR